jgi:hypothetical protein
LHLCDVQDEAFTGGAAVIHIIISSSPSYPRDRFRNISHMAFSDAKNHQYLSRRQMLQSLGVCAATSDSYVKQPRVFGADLCETANKPAKKLHISCLMDLIRLQAHKSKLAASSHPRSVHTASSQRSWRLCSKTHMLVANSIERFVKKICGTKFCQICSLLLILLAVAQALDELPDGAKMALQTCIQSWKVSSFLLCDVARVNCEAKRSH